MGSDGRYNPPTNYLPRPNILPPSPSPMAHDSFTLVRVVAQGNNAYIYDPLVTDSFAWNDVRLRAPITGFQTGEFPLNEWDLSQRLHTFTFHGIHNHSLLGQIVLKKRVQPVYMKQTPAITT